MAYTAGLFYVPGLTAAANYAAHQYKACQVLSTGCTLIATSVLTASVVGLLQNDPASGEEANLAVAGIAKGIAGTSTIVRGSLLGTDTTGRLVVTSTDNAFVVGKSLAAPTAVNDIFEVLLIPGGWRY